MYVHISSEGKDVYAHNVEKPIGGVQRGHASRGRVRGPTGRSKDCSERGDDVHGCKLHIKNKLCTRHRPNTAQSTC